MTFYHFASTGNVRRKTFCSLCGHDTGRSVGSVNYIGLGRYQVVQCPDCGLSSVDPMPSCEIFARGYGLYYQLQQSSYSRPRIIRSFQRDYRRGSHVARTVLSRHLPQDKPVSILEIGAGSGYFSQGVSHLFPESDITYIDIVEDLIRYYSEHFDCTALAGEFSAAMFPEKRFDLVIARDLIEHLTDPYTFMADVNAVLKPGGLFHFITPNGLENLWLTNQAFVHQGRETLILINHVHYFLPQVIDRLLASSGFEKTMAYKWGLKGYRKGLGHKSFPDPPEIPLPAIDPSTPIRLSSELWKHDPTEVTGSLLHGRGPAARLYSFFRDRNAGRCGFYDKRGRQFFVLARKLDEPEKIKPMAQAIKLCSL